MLTSLLRGALALALGVSNPVILTVTGAWLSPLLFAVGREGRLTGKRRLTWEQVKSAQRVVA